MSTLESYDITIVIFETNENEAISIDYIYGKNTIEECQLFFSDKKVVDIINK